jgi:DNA-binding SARP family transcriptional activator/tetratricopeptide (TPR) repeat protein
MPSAAGTGNVEFRVLGPLRVRSGEAVVEVPAARQRVVLAALVARARQVVSFEELAEAIWADRPASAPQVSVRNYVCRLRRVLGAAGGRIVTCAPGYLLDAVDDEVDLLTFARLCREGGAAVRCGDWHLAEDALGRALAMWRGVPLADVPSPVLRDVHVPVLESLRLQACEWRTEARLRLGLHAELVPELQRLVREQPLREGFRAQLMLALYRCGRQSEALAEYADARGALVSELGVEPGPELKALHGRILVADADLVPDPPPAAAAMLGAGTDGAVPRQLPAAVSHFTGRAAELETLSGMLDDPSAARTVVISALAGTAGVGKTAVAVHWAHQVAGRFPDGQLYVNLRGFDPCGIPAPPVGVVRGFLDALGVPPERIPASLEAQAGLYRSLLSGKRMLIVLDNARDEQQVRPLLPASPASLVIVTSRNQLSGLAAADGARLLTLDILSHAEAVQLLTARLGASRAASEPAFVEEIADLCACLPLALAVTAARAAARPGFPLAVLAAELRDAGGRLDALDSGDPAASVRAVFSWSYQQLPPDVARMFRLLALQSGPDITIAAAASLAAADRPGARRMLGELARDCLITEHIPGRYTLHDLLRAYAAEQARHTDSQADRDAATDRMLDHYLHTAAGAARVLNPAREPITLTPPKPGAAACLHPDYAHAMAWFEAEHHVLLAAVGLAARTGNDSHAWQLPWAMGSFLSLRGHWQEWADMQRTALAAATRLGDTAAQALTGRLLANACTNLGDHEQARRHYASSLKLHQQLGNCRGEARIHQNLGVLAERQGRYAGALGHAEQALRLYQAIGDKANEAETLNEMGWYHGLLGDYEQARAFCQRSLTLSAEASHRWKEGNTWDTLGYAEHHLGNLAEAAACYQRALSLSREAGDRFSEALALSHLGDTRHAAGELAWARQAWQQALAILEDLQHRDADQVRAKLAVTVGCPSTDPE